MADKHMKIKTTIIYHYYYELPIKMAKIKNSKSTKCRRGCGKLDLSYIAGGEIKWYRYTGNSLALFITLNMYLL